MNAEERYEIISLIGKGRTGGVYEAVDRKTNEKVALRRFFSISGDTNSSEWEESFNQLAATVSQMKHPALMDIYDYGVDEDGAYMVMELIRKGITIEDKINEDGHLSDENFYVMANNLLDAFAQLHHRGFCHGTVTSRSIMEVPVKPVGQIYKCIDLGQSSLIPVINPGLVRAIEDPAITAPEIFEGQAADSRSDVYMLGHLFYFSLAGGHPLAGVPEKEAYEKHKAHKFAPLSGYRSSVPKDIVEWLEKLTQANPNDRPQSASEALDLMPYHDFSKQQDIVVHTERQTLKAVAATKTQTFAAAEGVAVLPKVNPYVKTSTAEKNNTGLVVGLVVGAVAALIAVVAILFSGKENEIQYEEQGVEGDYGEQREIVYTDEKPSWLSDKPQKEVDDSEYLAPDESEKNDTLSKAKVNKKKKKSQRVKEQKTIAADSPSSETELKDEVAEAREKKAEDPAIEPNSKTRTVNGVEIIENLDGTNTLILDAP